MPIATADVKMDIEDDARSPQVMLAFYRRLFPYNSFFRWLNQDILPSRLWTHREFAFTLGESTYVRYNSFANAEEFKKEILSKNPTRFEIGPIYNARPRDRKTLQANALRPEQRELVFDIDMTDYDEIRTCCSGGAICKRCWGYIAGAVKVLDHSLREQFGFQHLLWVYSGRRGIHCWISDPTALALTDDQRKSLVTFLEVVKGGKEQGKKVNVRGTGDGGELHPSIEEAKELLKDVFVKVVLQDQDCFRSQAGYEALLSLLPADREFAGALRTKWQTADVSSSAKWADVMNAVNSLKDRPIVQRKAEKACEDILLQYTYPRIDAEVSKKRNHLLKSPFVIHPGTGRVCVPVDPLKVDEFDPERVPTVGQLLRELNTDVEMVDVKEEGGVRVRNDYDRTSLKPYVEMFDAHVKAVMKANQAFKKLTGKPVSMDF